VRIIDTAPSTRTVANAVTVEGFFALAWFSWGQERPSAWESVVLDIGAIVALLVAVGGILMARRARHEPPPLSGPAAGKRYGIIVATEFASIAVGAAILGATGHHEFIAAWVCLVVGIHFVPLDRVFPGIGMVGLAAAVVCVAVAAFVVGASTSIPPSAVTGLGAGACLLGHAASLLVIAAGRTRGQGRSGLDAPGRS
jgi:hypothetical protein